MRENDLVLLQYEEEEQLLLQLAELTSQGRLRWECSEYYALEPTFDSGLSNKTTNLLLSHSAKASAVRNSVKYNVEIIEGIWVPDGRVSFETAVELEAVSGGENLPDYYPRQISCGSTRTKEKLISAVFNQIYHSDVVREGLSFERFEQLINKAPYQGHDITKAMRDVWAEQDIVAVHSYLKGRIKENE